MKLKNQRPGPKGAVKPVKKRRVNLENILIKYGDNTYLYIVYVF
jgi:hypothetical protein